MPRLEPLPDRKVQSQHVRKRDDTKYKLSALKQKMQWEKSETQTFGTIKGGKAGCSSVNI